MASGMTKTQLARHMAEKVGTNNKTAAAFLEHLPDTAVKETKKSGIFVVPAFGQNVSTAPDAPSKEQVRQYFEIMHLRERMLQLVEGMKQGMKKGAEEGFKSKLANASPEDLKQVDAIADKAFEEFPLDEILD